jgi:hypothetical protein
MHITMASIHKPKSHDAPGQKNVDGVNGADAASVPTTRVEAAAPPAVAASEPKKATAAKPAPEPVPTGE